MTTRRSRATWSWPRLSVAVAAIAATLFPLYWILQQSFESSTEFAQGHPRLFPTSPTFENYRAILQDNYLQAIGNSLKVSSCVVLVTLGVGIPAAYALSRMFTRGKDLVLGLFVLAGFFPLTAMIGPLFLLYRDANLLDSLVGLAIADLIYTVPISVWLLTSLFDQLPWELEEAARVDGCGRPRAFLRVIGPVALPAITTVGILAFVLSWSDFAFSLSFLASPDNYTAPLAMVFLGQSKYQIFYNRTDAAVIVVIIPVLLLVFLAQRRIVAGLSAGALK